MINLTPRKLGKGYNQEIDQEKQLTEKPVINYSASSVNVEIMDVPEHQDCSKHDVWK